MRPRPRLRRTAKWAGRISLAVTSLAIAGSVFFLFSAHLVSGEWMSLSGGGVYVGHSMATPSAGCSFRLSRFHFTCLPSHWEHRHYWSVFVPLWPIPVGAVLLGMATLRDHILTAGGKRARAGRCPKCGYDRGGLTPDAPCPECGAKPA